MVKYDSLLSNICFCDKDRAPLKGQRITFDYDFPFNGSLVEFMSTSRAKLQFCQIYQEIMCAVMCSAGKDVLVKKTAM